MFLTSNVTAGSFSYSLMSYGFVCINKFVIVYTMLVISSYLSNIYLGLNSPFIIFRSLINYPLPYGQHLADHPLLNHPLSQQRLVLSCEPTDDFTDHPLAPHASLPPQAPLPAPLNLVKQMAIEEQSTSQVITSGGGGSVLIQKSEVGEGRVRGSAKVAQGEEGGNI